MLIRMGNLEATHATVQGYHIDAIAEGYPDIQKSLQAAQGAVPYEFSSLLEERRLC